MELKILCDRPEVFLELGVEGRCLGRVYIQLWWHLRRAHHFLALCLGTLGPSYVGSNFKNVVNKGEGKEHVQAGDYITPDGSKSGQGLMDNLEWGGEHRGKAREGVVAGASCGSQNLDACFLICTIAHPDRHFKCPFGQVVSGLRLVRQVVNIDPISQVTITDCGFVTL
ncbi:peptidyl-prolyl cis-trans isomerase 2-like [Homarus americanus]|nr:peptidyl-prolyl cis-trans isomerase 2-like [Homarus americanus]